MTRPDGVAVHAGGEAIRWRELERRVTHLAGRLAAAGVGRGSVAAVATGDPLYILQLLHALPRLGAALYPLEAGQPPARRERLLAQAGVEHQLPTDPERLPQPVPFACEPGDPERLRLIIATSGSGGEPRGVMLGAGALAAASAAAVERLQLARSDLWLVCLPLFHIGGIAALLRSAHVGAGLVLSGRFDAERVWDALHCHPVTHISLVPAMLARLLDVAGDRPPPAALRVVLTGGAGLSAPLAARARAAHWPIWASYGMSETAALIAARPVDGRWRPGRVGAPHPALECTFDAGRIRLRGPVLMTGYANPERRPGDGLSDGWLTTADLGGVEGDELVLRGRADQVLVSGGENIHPEEVELLVAGCPGLAEAAVAGVDDPVWGERLVLLYAGAAGPDAVERWCLERITGARRPRAFIRLAALPRTGSGKLDRAALRRAAIGVSGYPSGFDPASGISA